jgi:hypothetical protein
MTRLGIYKILAGMDPVVYVTSLENGRSAIIGKEKTAQRERVAYITTMSPRILQTHAGERDAAVSKA